MSLGPIHSQTSLDLPLDPQTGAVILGVGLLVLVIISYDIYRQQFSGEEW